jgi:hypothetical protein
MNRESYVRILEKKLNCDIVNLSRAGCGNQYIHDSVVAEVTERDYDLVLVQWTAPNIVEFRTQYTTELFDWEIYNGNKHHHLLQKDWMWNHTPDHVMPSSQEAIAKNEMFKSRFKLTPGAYANHQTMLMQILSLQSILKSYNIPYVFIFYRKLLQLKQFKRYYDRIDWHNVHDQHLFRIAKDNNHWNDETYHPTSAAYEYYAEEIINFLSTKNLIEP